MGGAVPERADEGRKMLGNYWAWRAGEIKAFWFFEPVESLGGRMAARKEERTRAASSVRSETTPLLPLHAKQSFQSNKTHRKLCEVLTTYQMLYY